LNRYVLRELNGSARRYLVVWGFIWVIVGAVVINWRPPFHDGELRKGLGSFISLFGICAALTGVGMLLTPRTRSAEPDWIERVLDGTEPPPTV
jgi:hypothetical protein